MGNNYINELIEGLLSWKLAADIQSFFVNELHINGEKELFKNIYSLSFNVPRRDALFSLFRVPSGTSNMFLNRKYHLRWPTAHKTNLNLLFIASKPLGFLF